LGLAIWLRSKHRETEAPNDFLALSLILLAYVGAEWIGAWGFLAAFAAGLGFRHAEVDVSQEHPVDRKNRKKQGNDDGSEDVPAEHHVTEGVSEEDLQNPAIASGVVVSEVISFGNTAERLLEVLMVILVGVCLAFYWDWRAVPLALALFFVIRPIAVMLFLLRSPTARFQRLMMAWFGIRGLGSLYYLSYALNHGLQDNVADLVGLTLSVVALSILLHGITSQPLLNLYEKMVERAKREN
jgi:NhaP-type Na+/H+ or K+/H+ antiporter